MKRVVFKIVTEENMQIGGNIFSKAHPHNHAFAGERVLDSVNPLTYTNLTNVPDGTPNTMHSHPVLFKTFAFTILTWLISSEAGAFDKYLTTFEQIPSPNFGRVNAILRDERGFVWFATDRGLCKYDGYQVRVFAIGSASDEKQQIVTSMIKMDKQSFLLGTGKGLWSFNLTTGQSSPFPEGSEFSGARVNAIVEDSGGTIWIGTNSLGLFRYDRTTTALQRYTTSNGLGSNGTLSLTLDRSRKLWIGTLGGGLNMLDRQTSQIVQYRSRANDPATLYSDDISALCMSDNQELWIGTNVGLNILRLETGVMRRVDLHSHIEHTIMSITQDRSGRMWIAVLDLGLVFNSNGVFTTFTTLGDVGRSLNSIRTLYPDPVASAGNNLLLWVGARNGVNKILMSTNPFTNHIRNQDSLYLDRGAVLSLCEDRNGILWAGMWGGGLDMLRRVNGSYQRIANFKNNPTNPSSLPHNDVVAIMEDRNGNLWNATAGGLAVLVDKRNDLWLSTGIGLAKFSPKTQTFTRFDEKHGISFTELRSGFYKNASGRLFVGGLDGFTEFHPDSISLVSHPPAIAITSLSVFDNELQSATPTNGEITFSHDQNFISFSFAALDYADPLRNRFAYKMVGVDNDWVEAGTRNYASYPNLNPGHYTFQVKGSNSNNVWNEAGTSISIVIAPPYWQTWWFRFLLAAAIAGMIYAVYRYRVRKLLELERLRLRIADDLHDDVGSNLSAIAMVSRSLQRAPELSRKTYNKISEIYETAVVTSEGMKDLVWFIKPENDTLDNLFLRMKDTASALLGDIETDFQGPGYDESKSIAIDFKRTVFLAFKEIVTNVAKHSMATRVEINLTVRDRMFEMIVADNGKGFDLASISRGNGLQSLQKRARAIGGSCAITSEPGGGTTVMFKGKM